MLRRPSYPFLSIFLLLLLVWPASLAISSQTDDGGLEVFLAQHPALSPDGQTLVFSWQGALWSVPSEGGQATELTRHPARDEEPAFSPDGAHIAFTSDRTGDRQIYVMPADGGLPEQASFHTAGHSLQEWFPDGEGFLVRASRDFFHMSGGRQRNRLLRVHWGERRQEELLFDAYVTQGTVSPDGRRVLFARDGEAWWRKGYHGSNASKILLYDMDADEYTTLIQEDFCARSPQWRPDGQGFYFVSSRNGAFNLWEYELADGAMTRLTSFEDDGIVSLAASRDGKTLVFRRLFHFYRFRPGVDDEPARLDIHIAADLALSEWERQTLRQASDVSFSKDGLEIAFIAGRDVWVMDTVLREPVQVTSTGGEESNILFAPDGQSLLFVSDMDGEENIWRARRDDPDQYWWRNTSFELERVTTDALRVTGLSFSPDESQLAWVQGRGDLIVAQDDGTSPQVVVESFHGIDYDWSPDGKWIAYSVIDGDANSDVWITPVDLSRSPVNISLHPNYDRNPVWSPDGKRIAFLGRRRGAETDIHYVNLTREVDETTQRDRKLQEALEKLNKARPEDKKEEPKKPDPTPTPTPTPDDDDDPTTSAVQSDSDATPSPTDDDDATTGAATASPSPTDTATPSPTPTPEDPDAVKIDFDGLADRVQRVAIRNATPSGLFWSHDGKKLAFAATINGRRGIYTIGFPDGVNNATFLTGTIGSRPVWVAQGALIRWLVNGVPSTMAANGRAESFPFSARWELRRADWYRAGFLAAWRNIRDLFYDDALNNLNWDRIREKYEDRAAQAPDPQTLASVINLMFGELNASHMGFSASDSPWRPSDGWRDETAWLGVWFDRNHEGPGLKVSAVLPRSPADRDASRLAPDDIILTIDDMDVTPPADLTLILNGPLDRDLALVVQDADAETTRAVTMRPMGYGAATSRVREKWIDDCRQLVNEMSDDAMGYLHIEGMNWPSFDEFEKEIYARGVGKDGLIIDVRNNGGGNIHDHLLTVLCQPRHMISVNGAGVPGDPLWLRVYARWDKPVVVLCNHNSFSNAEIFGHAIQHLERGPVVGVPTPGAVIWTSSRGVMGLGAMRMPYIGAFKLADGEDMELNGVVPEHIVWPEPGELPQGVDRQLEKAIEVLRDEIEAYRQNPMPTPRPASQRRLEGDAPGHRPDRNAPSRSQGVLAREAAQ